MGKKKLNSGYNTRESHLINTAKLPYVFVVGLNKSGTTSLDKAFKELGWSPLHGPYKFNAAVIKAIQQGRNLLHFLPGFNMFSDIFYPFHDYGHICMEPANRRQFLEMLDEQYPGSKFIINIRNKSDWLNSRRNHVIRNQRNLDYKLQWLTINEDTWSQEYDVHYEIMFDYFSGRKDALILHIERNMNYQTICEFLEIPVINKDFPKKGVTKKQLTD